MYNTCTNIDCTLYNTFINIDCTCTIHVHLSIVSLHNTCILYQIINTTNNTMPQGLTR